MQTYTFAVYNLDEEPPFEAFLLDVPTSIGVEAAARRAYFTAMAHLSNTYGVDVDGFQVAEWVNNAPGRAVGPGGFMH